MKKLYSIILFVLIVAIANAQYTKLLDFAGATNGSVPQGSLMQATNGMLYGMTQQGGANTYGILFQYDPSTNIYIDKLDFAGTTNGRMPTGSLISDGTFLYGMTDAGGTNDDGTVFKIKFDGTGYVKLHDFGSASDGSVPNGSLISDGTFLYGMTSIGGTKNFGTIFKIKFDGTGYIKLLDFAGVTNGNSPLGSLMQASDGMLYGMTEYGGASQNGNIFKIKTDGSAYVNLLDFAGATNGQYPYGSLMQASDGMLYGMTFNGGANNMGVLFQYNPVTYVYTKKIDFAGVTNGQNPISDLIQASDGILYGMTHYGGATANGIIFQYDPATSTYIKKLDFAGATNGRWPYGSLMQASDGMLYGMTADGGTNVMGVLFKYGIGATGISEMTNDELKMTISPNPTTGMFIIQSAEKISFVEIYNMYGEKNLSLTHSFTSSLIDLSSQPSGIYFLQLKTEQGLAVKKIVISK